jgi:hypothetical protein
MFKPVCLIWGLSAAIFNRLKNKTFLFSTDFSDIPLEDIDAKTGFTFNISYDVLEDIVWLDDRQCQLVARNNGGGEPPSTHVELSWIPR